MDWIFDNIQMLIAAAAAVAYWLNQRNKAKGAADEESPDEVEGESLLEPEDEPKSLIPEGMQRRILEELGIPQPELEPQLPPEPPIIPELPPPLPVVVAEPPAVLPVVRSAVQTPNHRAESPSPQTRSSDRRDALRGALHSGGKIREAMLLREILGPPIGLRPRDDSGAR